MKFYQLVTEKWLRTDAHTHTHRRTTPFQYPPPGDNKSYIHFKRKLLMMSKLSFCNNIFKRSLLHMQQSMSVGWKGLINSHTRLSKPSPSISRPPEDGCVMVCCGTLTVLLFCHTYCSFIPQHLLIFYIRSIIFIYW